MFFLRCCGLGLLACLLATPAAYPTDDKKAVPNDFFGVWIEEKLESAGMVYVQPNDLFAWDLAANDGGCWLRRGESVYSRLGTVRVNVEKNPIWLDFIGEKTKVKVGDEWKEKVGIRPGIVKREGKKLIWTWAKDWYFADPGEVAGWSLRPKSFEVKKDDPWEKKTLYPSRGRYTTD